MYQTTEGIVLREIKYNDADKLLEVLTRDLGRLTLKARGVLRSKSTLKSACQLLCYAEFTFTERQGKAVITEAAPIEQFHELRNDLELLALGSYFAEAALLLSQQDAPDDGMLSLLLNSLYALCKLNKPQLLVKAAFELRAAVLAGFAPDLHSCAVCGSDEPALFDVLHGGLLCQRCGPQEEGLRLPVSAGVLAAMRHIAGCPLKKLFSFTLGEASLSQLSGVTEIYLSTQLEHSFRALEFYKKTMLIHIDGEPYV